MDGQDIQDFGYYRRVSVLLALVLLAKPRYVGR